eukprot:CAMPEP_0204223136 /NCGR_PEP_ID=MMETSP0361-20130328/82626_1 /ASSEMBLY_ACC=CAM_ASM_000343 /TAXON_ID=268821 /ORGANISM="Scrippsiella Hangoei, Strain SHTV-5" /LENGTH=67 /DNA_ID=CAMNT_0051188817 /DNA_START=57 /DNA_END=256 /DNA_ORIENTATION=+
MAQLVHDVFKPGCIGRVLEELRGVLGGVDVAQVGRVTVWRDPLSLVVEPIRDPPQTTAALLEHGLAN